MLCRPGDSWLVTAMRSTGWLLAWQAVERWRACCGCNLLAVMGAALLGGCAVKLRSWNSITTQR
jgi:hypothetical protein